MNGRWAKYSKTEEEWEELKRQEQEKREYYQLRVFQSFLVIGIIVALIVLSVLLWDALLGI